MNQGKVRLVTLLAMVLVLCSIPLALIAVGMLFIFALDSAIMFVLGLVLAVLGLTLLLTIKVNVNVSTNQKG